MRITYLKSRDKCLILLNYFSDVHWVWHVHMLAPTTYKKDLERLYGRMLNHNPGIWVKDPSKTKKLWNEMWPNEPFERKPEVNYDLTEHKSHQSQFQYDILSAVQRQKLFFYQKLKECWLSG